MVHQKFKHWAFLFTLNYGRLEGMGLSAVPGVFFKNPVGGREEKQTRAQTLSTYHAIFGRHGAVFQLA